MLPKLPLLPQLPLLPIFLPFEPWPTIELSFLLEFILTLRSKIGIVLFYNWDKGTALRPMGTALRPMGTASRLMGTKTFAEGGFAIQAGTVEPGSQVLLEL